MRSTALPEQPNLPTLESGLHLLTVDDRATGALQSLVVDHLLGNDGDVHWVDSHGNARTTLLSKLTPSRRLLDRVYVGRGFTAFQHHSLVTTLAERLDATACLGVLPAVDALYRTDDLRRREGERLLADVCGTLADLASEVAMPLLVTCERHDAFVEPVREIATEVIECELTQFGPRFATEEFETLVYPVEDGWLQTTLAYWQEILEARVAATDQQPADPAYGTN